MNKKFTIKFTISSIIISMVTFISILLTYLHYNNSVNNSYKLLGKFTNTISYNIIQRTVNYLHKTNTEIKILANSNKTNNILNNKENNIALMKEIVTLEKHIHSIYIADINGNFLQVNNIGGLNVIDKIDGFNTNDREWFIKANERIQITKPYNFFSDNTLGFTAYYANYDDKGNKLAVVGVDISMDTLVKFIKRQAFNLESKILVIDNKFNTFIISSNDALNNKYRGHNFDDIVDEHILIRSSKRFLSGEKNGEILKYNNSAYLFSGTRLQFDNANLSVVICSHEDVIVGSLVDDIQFSVYLSVAILMFFILIALWVAKKISRPISKLSDEISELKELKTSIDISDDSKIYEIYLAQNSLVQLKNGMDSFKKYMPLELVSKLIQSNTPIKIGGEEKYLVVMFTDIEGFTTIGEGMTPTELTTQLSEYFGHMQEIIKKYEGTVDKYIGDAIMVFWGAPLDVEEPVLKAVLCAVEMQKKLETVNEAWKKEGRAELITRIGLHYGITLVGNIGSKDRMNYTIMGDSVNIAARLETINKEYGTRIMISNEVNEVVKDELPTRYIGDIELKGKTKSTKIYTVVYT